LLRRRAKPGPAPGAPTQSRNFDAGIIIVSFSRLVGRSRQWSLLILLLAVTTACQHLATRDTTVITSDHDQRSYRYVELPNHLRVLLISDPNTDKAAAALDVGVGSREDPADRQGLAHFLEHMLFLGTDRYPQADAYQQFISAHGGHHNAFTAFEHTNYFFDISSENLEPALDRFSRFFVAPLFSAEYVDREKHAVYSEYTANIRDDQRRGLDVLREVVNPQHPFAKFSVGSLDTLADRPGHPVRADLLSFYQRNYSANLMTLVVLGRESLDQLQAMVTPRFSAVPDHERDIEPVTTPLFAPAALPELVRIQPVQQQRTLAFAWPIGDQRDDYRGKSLEYIGNILGHEGKGSLLSALKQRGWAQALSAGRSFDYHGGALFNVNVELTEAGVAHTDEIARLLFQTINRIRDGGIKDWLYREQQEVAQQRFRFREHPEPIDEVSRLAGNLQDYPPAEVIRGDYLMKQFEPARIRALLARLTPGNLLLTLTAPGEPTDRSSTYYHTPYSVQPLAPAQLTEWNNAGLDAAIQLPQPNIFIAADFSVKPLQQVQSKPVLLEDGGGLHLWFRQDPVFRLPKAVVTIGVRSPLAGDSPAHTVKTELLARMARENLNEFSYPASLAGLNYSIGSSGRGLTLRVSGFNDKQAVLLQRMLDALRNPQIEAERFARVRREYRRELQDSGKRPPYQLLLADLQNVLYRSHWPDAELAAQVDQVTAAELRQFAQQLFSGVDINMLVYGNYVEADARRLGQLVQQQLLAGATAVAAPPVQVLQLPAAQDYRRTLPAAHDDAALLWYRQAADNSKITRAALGVSAQMLSADFYTKLRTEQQLGYVVMSTPFPVRDVPGLVFLTQSPVAGPAQLAEAYRRFLQHWRGIDSAALRPLFERHRAALAQLLKEEPKNLGEADARLWQDLNAGYLNFDSREQLLEAVENLTFEQWLALFRRDALAPAGHALWLAVDGRFPQQALRRGAAVNALQTFKEARQFYSFP
jgi:secreted Zn-dependent insulinase-like peptidase